LVLPSGRTAAAVRSLTHTEDCNCMLLLFGLLLLLYVIVIVCHRYCMLLLYIVYCFVSHCMVTMDSELLDKRNGSK
jgi:hypothetical protein